MPSIRQHQSINLTKCMLIGDPGAGKSGCLASLVTAGYKLRILDCDNGLDSLRSYLTDPASPYVSQLAEKKINLDEAVQFVTITEQMKSINGRIIPAKASVWDRSMKLLSQWKDGDTDLGSPATWGADCVLVIDSLTMLSNAALNFVQAANGRLGSDPQGNDWRRDIGVAQAMIERLLQMLYDEHFRTNVVLISHISFLEERNSGTEGLRKGYPSSLGAALSPKIPRYFNNVLQLQVVGTGQNAKRKLTSRPNGMVDLKTSSPLRVKPEYDISNGLAEFFSAVKGVDRNVAA